MNNNFPPNSTFGYLQFLRRAYITWFLNEHFLELIKITDNLLTPKNNS